MKGMYSSTCLACCLLFSTSLAANTVSIVSDATWKSSDTGSTGWETVAFDDSSWVFARAPYPNLNDPPIIPGTSAVYIWHDPTGTSDGTTGVTRAFFRYKFNLDAVAQSGQALINVDDDYDFYVNGVLADANHDFGFGDSIQSVDFTDKLVVGKNVFAFEAIDGGWPNAFNRGFESLLFDANITTVPVPAAAWLFGSGLLYLIGIARRKKAA